MRGVVHSEGQSSIFDAIAANQAAERGIDLAATNNRPMLVLARLLAVEIGRQKQFVTADDVQRALLDAGHEETALGNAAGSVFRGGQWKWDGVSVRKSKRVASHGRLIRVWEFVGNGEWERK